MANYKWHYIESCDRPCENVLQILKSNKLITSCVKWGATELHLKFCMLNWSQHRAEVPVSPKTHTHRSPELNSKSESSPSLLIKKLVMLQPNTGAQGPKCWAESVSFIYLFIYLYLDAEMWQMKWHQWAFVLCCRGLTPSMRKRTKRIKLLILCSWGLVLCLHNRKGGLLLGCNFVICFKQTKYKKTLLM